jgi:hypothetical protein
MRELYEGFMGSVKCKVKSVKGGILPIGKGHNMMLIEIEIDIEIEIEGLYTGIGNGLRKKCWIAGV